MSMKHYKLVFAAAAGLLLVLIEASGGEMSAGRPEEALGCLGVRFGTIVVIEGTAIEGGKPEIPESQNDNGSLFLRVERLDGKPLTEPAYLRMAVDPLVQVASEKLPKVSERFALRGYEAGHFIGSPQAVYEIRNGNTALPAGWGLFRFKSIFYVTGVNKGG